MTSGFKLAIKNSKAPRASLREGFMLTGTDKAYAAGLFDGEGSVLISRPRPSKGYTLMVSLAMREPTAVTWLQNHWPGSLRPYARRSKSGEPFTVWYWRRSTSAAAAFLTDILPYLLVKRTQAQLAVEFQSRKSVGRRLTDGILALDASYHTRLLALRQEPSRVAVIPPNVATLAG
jgi:hypothetical protein